MPETEEVEIIPGVVGPRSFEPSHTLVVPETGHEVHIRVVFDDAERRYVCDEVRVRRAPQTQPPAEPVTTDALRRVPIASMMRLSLLVTGEGFPHALRDMPNPGGREPWGRALPDDLERKPSSRVLAWVAHMYRLGHAIGEPPTKTVQEMFGLSRTTAIRWIMAARDKGYLDPTDVGKAGG